MPEKNIAKWRQAARDLSAQAKQIANINQSFAKLAETVERTTGVFRGFFLRVLATENILVANGILTKESINEEVTSIIQANRKDTNRGEVPSK